MDSDEAELLFRYIDPLSKTMDHVPKTNKKIRQS